MIVEAVVGAVLDVFAWVLGLLPTFTLPPALQPDGLVDLVAPFASALGAAGRYVDVTALLLGVVGILAAFAVAFAVKGLLGVLGLATGGGTAGLT